MQHAATAMPERCEIRDVRNRYKPIPWDGGPPARQCAYSACWVMTTPGVRRPGRHATARMALSSSERWRTAWKFGEWRGARCFRVSFDRCSTIGRSRDRVDAAAGRVDSSQLRRADLMGYIRRGQLGAGL